jgi:hypothetical protein
MAQGLVIINGFCFGVGLILASAAMKILFHMSFC